MKKRIFSMILAACLLLGTLSGCGILDELTADKTFSSNGMSISLRGDFRQTTYEGYTVVYENSTIAVFCLEEKFSLFAGTGTDTLDAYAQLLLKANQLEGKSTVQHSDNLTWFDYNWTNESLGVEYYYFTTVHMADDAFWMVQFAVPEAMAEGKKDDFIRWAQSVSFAQ